MCEEELQLMADKCHSLQDKCQLLKEDVAWYKDQLAKYVVANDDLQAALADVHDRP
jgi:hypothetical protein